MKKRLSSLVFALFGLMILTGCRTTPPAPPRVSILGDSYSTFRGWIPEGNAIYYPQTKGNNDVKNAEECWWHLVTAAIG
ncbi:MAG: hypothetical protein IKX48_12950, partial [Victivallales bacterium]|nr:hypothetical protein [Victivallales bacterium]